MATATRYFETLDIYLTSFLFLLGHKPDLERVHGKVIFRFRVTDSLYDAISYFNSGAEVNVADYVTIVKALRGRMLTMRGVV
jgi:hypothetical protein